jgi:hypothetical protein
MTAPTTRAVAAHILSHPDSIRSAGERAAWRRGFMAGCAAVVFGSIGLVLLLALVNGP